MRLALLAGFGRALAEPVPAFLFVGFYLDSADDPDLEVYLGREFCKVVIWA